MERSVQSRGRADAMVAVEVESFGSRISGLSVALPVQFDGGDVPFPPPVPPLEPVVNNQKSSV